MGTFRSIQYLFIFVILLILAGCAKKESEEYSDSEIIARVGDRVITTSEFIRRAEYTPRPIYCRGDNYIHQKIVLNSIIGEKLLALDLESQQGFQPDEAFQTYLLGRKEQAMRQLHRYELGKAKADPGNDLLINSLKNARRKYEVRYFSVPDSGSSQQVKELLEQGHSFESIYSDLSGGQPLEDRTVSWFDNDLEIIRESLFANPLSRDSVLTPIDLGNGSYMFMKILGWSDEYSLSDRSNEILWNDVVEKVETRIGSQLYDDYVSDLMRGKTMQFEKATFIKLVNDLAEIYMLKGSQKEDLLNQAIWDIEQRHMSHGELKQDIQYMNDVLFTFDGVAWTVKDFYDLLEKHPLVFRDQRFPMTEFGNQVRLAIADLIRDYSVTNDAYDLGYDKKLAVTKHVELWKDHYYADLYKRAIMRSVDPDVLQGMSTIRFLRDVMNPVIDSLQVEYSDQIFINFTNFDSIKLTSVDMFVTQSNVPYPIMVPSFPKIYSDHVFDYGNKIETQ